ncbi:DMT family transporter [Sneathiella limimaris]|uniref:DMT family transporter n=1 Tax=Sneathiella limimaris TaxID=1964213 RepID=UPI00146AF35A|nr:DMT family transporter [Sneathiella limimaris]
MSAPQQQQSGVLIMAMAMLALPVMDLFAKLLTETMSPGSVAFARFFAQSLIMLPFLFISGQQGRPTLLHLLAGLFLGSALVALNTALKAMPIANALVIFFVEPLFLTILSAVILKEGFGWRRMIAVFLGLIGAIVVLRPNFQAFGIASIFPLITALCFSCYLLITRFLSQKGSRVSLNFWTGFFAASVLGLALIPGTLFEIDIFAFDLPTGHQFFYVLGMGALAGVGHWMIALAFSRTEAGVLAPLQYLEIISATILGWLVFNEFPDPMTWLGTVIIIGAGFYVFYRERKLSKPQGPIVID